MGDRGKTLVCICGDEEWKAEMHVACLFIPSHIRLRQKKQAKTHAGIEPCTCQILTCGGGSRAVKRGKVEARVRYCVNLDGQLANWKIGASMAT